jgi:hypothetical protein
MSNEGIKMKAEQSNHATYHQLPLFAPLIIEPPLLFCRQRRRRRGNDNITTAASTAAVDFVVATVATVTFVVFVVCSDHVHRCSGIGDDAVAVTVAAVSIGTTAAATVVFTVNVSVACIARRAVCR